MMMIEACLANLGCPGVSYGYSERDYASAPQHHVSSISEAHGGDVAVQYVLICTYNTSTDAVHIISERGTGGGMVCSLSILATKLCSINQQDASEKSAPRGVLCYLQHRVLASTMSEAVAGGGMLVVAPLYHESARRSRRQGGCYAPYITVYYHQ
jgi:hypothetical protein